MKEAISVLSAYCGAAALHLYPHSSHALDGKAVCMAGDAAQDYLLSAGDVGLTGERFEADGFACTKAPLDHKNACVLRALFPFTAPVPVLKRDRTVGVGDRLGIATPGHIRVFEKYDATPVFAQQSIRELTLTKRTFEDVLDSATFAVFREGFTRGFGADGDHLKTPEEIEYALGCGYTMITLDCSEHIRNDILAMTDAEVDRLYAPDAALEARYLGKTFTVENRPLTFAPADFKRMCLIYGDAIRFASDMYARYFAHADCPPDFEVSIDETATPTEPNQHYFVASELIARGVNIATMAPRFVGEFQKGVDYRGDLAEFERDFAVHAAIARHFGYKISVHSGSDKFSVFPIVGKYTQGRFHLKTAGTNWLEAMRVIAEHEPALYREIHAYALDTAFAEARKYYHVTTDLTKIPPLASLADADLPALFAQDDARQLIHITYGLILNAKNPDGTDRFRTRLYAAWRKYGDEYADRLEKHIGRHLALLYSGFAK